MANFQGEIPTEAIYKAYTLLKANTIRREDELHRMNGKQRQDAGPAVAASRKAMKDIENWWLDISDGSVK